MSNEHVHPVFRSILKGVTPESAQLRKMDGDILINAEGPTGQFMYAAQSVDGAVALLSALRAAGFVCRARIWHETPHGAVHGAAYHETDL